MKNKFIILSLALASFCGTVNAQDTENYYTKKWTDNIFVGAGVGAMSVLNDGTNPATFNFNPSCVRAAQGWSWVFFFFFS